MTAMSQLRGLVAWQDGRVSPQIYFDEEIHAREQDRVFARSWIPVGHEDMVRDPGSYITNFIGDVPIILVRDLEGTLRAFINRCRHRGNTVCLFDRGTTRNFTCSYHGWSYGVNGKLAGVPRERELYDEPLDRDAWGLEAIAVASYEGLVFASLEKPEVSLDAWLGEETKWWLRTFVLASDVGGLEMLPGWHRYAVPGNWKLMSENFIGDNYHVPLTHAGWVRAAQRLREQGSTIPMITSPLPIRAKQPTYEVTANYGAGCPLGLGALIEYSEELFQRDLDEAISLGPEVEEWVRYRQDRLTKALAEVDFKPYGFINGLLFPNLGLMGYISPMIGRHFLLFHPKGPGAHEVWQWTMLEREMPEVARDVALKRVYQGQAMAGVIAPDDVENFERVEEAMRPQRAWRLPLNFEVHLKSEQPLVLGLPGNVGAEPSEVNQRQFYRFWLQMMMDGAKRDGNGA